MAGTTRDTGENATVPLRMIVTSRAAYYADGISLKPCNWVKVDGPAGHTMNCNLSSGGEIIGLNDPNDGSQLPSILYGGDGTSYGTGPYLPTLDENGFTWFLVRGENPSLPHAASELLVVTVNVTDENDDSNTATKYPTFQDYSDANPQNDPNQHLVGYDYTTGAPADGVTPCCLYVQADSASWGVVRVTVTAGSATVVGSPPEHPHWNDVNLQSDGCATILLVDTNAESVKFTIGLPKAPGTDQLGPFTLDFLSFSE